MRKGETECIRFERAMAKMLAEKRKHEESLKKSYTSNKKEEK